MRLSPKCLSLSLAALCLSAMPAMACPTGKPVEIEWNGGQFPGVVLDGPDAQGNCLVSYDGYDETWNEWVATSRLTQLDVAPTASLCPVGEARRIEWNGSMWDGTILDGPNVSGECFVTYVGWSDDWNEWVGQDRIQPADVVAPAGASCPVGQPRQIFWNESWWNGSVLNGPDASGQCLVSYDGYDESWNEWVAADRLRPVQ